MLPCSCSRGLNTEDLSVIQAGGAWQSDYGMGSCLGSQPGPCLARCLLSSYSHKNEAVGVGTIRAPRCLLVQFQLGSVSTPTSPLFNTLSFLEDQEELDADTNLEVQR